jgi:hypothetical protein
MGGMQTAFVVADLVTQSSRVPDVLSLARMALRESVHVRVQQLAFGIGLGSYDRLNVGMGGFATHMHMAYLMDAYDGFHKIAGPYLDMMCGVDLKHDILVGCLAWCFDVPVEVLERTIFSRRIEMLHGCMSSSRYQSLQGVVSAEFRPSTTFIDWCVVHLKWRRVVGYDVHHRARLVCLSRVDYGILESVMEDLVNVTQEYAEAMYAPRVVLESADHTLAPARLCGYSNTNDSPQKRSIWCTDE